MSQFLQYPIDQSNVFCPNLQQQQSQNLMMKQSMNTWSTIDSDYDAISNRNSFRGRRASGEVPMTQDVLSLCHNEFKPMKMNFDSFIPQDKQQNYANKEIDQKSFGSVTTKSTSEQGAFDNFEEGALDENSDAMREYNNYCEATRKKQKKIFNNAEERQEFNQNVEMKRKTEMCKNIIHFGECKFGDNCSYAHSRDELLKKKHVQSNYMTKLCQQFHDPQQGVCNYGERCQFLHSIYDRRKPIGFMQGLFEGARLTMLRAEQISDSQGADLVWVNLVKGDGCGAPKSRLPVFENIYNKEQWQIQQQEDQQSKILSKKPHNFAKHNSLRKCQTYQQAESNSFYPQRQCKFQYNNRQTLENQRSNYYQGQSVF